jgi:proteasome activator subunit 4
MEDDDILEIDSPLEQPVDIDDDEVDELLLEGRNGRSTTATSTNSMKPIHYPSKPEDRSSMMLYSESLPYECESLEEFDARMDLICRRLVDCVRTKE